MSFNNPAAFFGALLAIPIVAFYLLRVRLRRQPVSTLMFWEQAFEEKPPRALWRQLRHLASLLVQLSILALLVFTLADPIDSNHVEKQRRVVVVVDTSVSMQAKIPGSGEQRLDAALDYLSALIDAMRPSDELCIVTAGTRAGVACGFTGHQRELRSQLEQIQATDGPGKVNDAVSLAKRLAGETLDAEVVLLSDGGFSHAKELLADSEVVVPLAFPAVNNVAITQFQVRPDGADLSSYQLLIEVRNFSQQPAALSLELSFNGQLRDVIPLSIAASDVWREVISDTAIQSGVLSAELKTSSASVDALPADNAAWAILPQRQRLLVHLVSEGNWFLEKVLEANSAVEFLRTNNPSAAGSRADVTILHHPVSGPVPQGPTLIIYPQFDSEFWTVAETVDDALFGQNLTDSPILNNVRLDNVRMPAVVQIKPRGQHTVLAESASGDPLLLHFPRDNGDLIVLTPNPEQGDLPLRTAFPILLGNLLNSFTQDFQQFRPAAAVGEFVRVSVDGVASENLEGDTHWQVTSTNDESSTLAVPCRDGNVVVGPIGRAGVWLLEQVGSRDNLTGAGTDSDQSIMLAFNIANALESDTRNVFSRADTSRSRRSLQVSRPAWFWLTMSLVVLTIAEWVLYQRRWIA